jgi:uncharacterized OB-fold protein
LTAATEETDEELVERFPGVQLDHVNKHFYRGLLHKEVRLNRCEECGFWHHRPKPRCPACLSKRVTATPIRGTGTIYLLTFVYQGVPEEGVDYSSGHPVATVELDEQEGLRFASTVIGSANEEISFGDRVQLDWITRLDRPFPVWRKITEVEGTDA